jgi:hypothetical protein
VSVVSVVGEISQTFVLQAFFSHTSHIPLLRNHYLQMSSFPPQTASSSVVVATPQTTLEACAERHTAQMESMHIAESTKARYKTAQTIFLRYVNLSSTRAQHPEWYDDEDEFQLSQFTTAGFKSYLSMRAAGTLPQPQVGPRSRELRSVLEKSLGNDKSALLNLYKQHGVSVRRGGCCLLCFFFFFGVLVVVGLLDVFPRGAGLAAYYFCDVHSIIWNTSSYFLLFSSSLLGCGAGRLRRGDFGMDAWLSSRCKQPPAKRRAEGGARQEGALV